MDRPGQYNAEAPISKATFNPALMMLAIALIAAVLTYILPSGEYQRNGKMVVPGTYRVLEKEVSAHGILTSGGEKAQAALEAADKAAPVGLFDFFTAVPEGIAKQAALVIMVLFVGGMFGILNKSGAVQAGLERVLALTRNNIYILVPVLMLIFSVGTTFLGFSKEYLLMIPIMVALANRMGLPNIIGLSVVALGNMVGHMASITNPYILTIAQPMLGVPLFSGMWLRVVTYVVMLSVATLFVFWRIRRNGMVCAAQSVDAAGRLSTRQVLMLLTLAVGVGFLIYASHSLHWKAVQLSGYYLFLALVIGAISGLGANTAADAFVSGVRKNGHRRVAYRAGDRRRADTGKRKNTGYRHLLSGRSTRHPRPLRFRLRHLRFGSPAGHRHPLGGRQSRRQYADTRPLGRTVGLAAADDDFRLPDGQRPEQYVRPDFRRAADFPLRRRSNVDAVGQIRLAADCRVYRADSRHAHMGSVYRVLTAV
nr:hypothetical protein [Neisseria sicca]